MREHGSGSVAEDAVDRPGIETGVPKLSLDRLGFQSARKSNYCLIQSRRLRRSFERIFHKRCDLGASALKSCKCRFGFRPGAAVNRTRIQTDVAQAQLHGPDLFSSKLSS